MNRAQHRRKSPQFDDQFDFVQIFVVCSLVVRSPPNRSFAIVIGEYIAVGFSGAPASRVCFVHSYACACVCVYDSVTISADDRDEKIPPTRPRKTKDNHPHRPKEHSRRHTSFPGKAISLPGDTQQQHQQKQPKPKEFDLPISNTHKHQIKSAQNPDIRTVEQRANTARDWREKRKTSLTHPSRNNNINCSGVCVSILEGKVNATQWLAQAARKFPVDTSRSRFVQRCGSCVPRISVLSVHGTNEQLIRRWHSSIMNSSM